MITSDDFTRAYESCAPQLLRGLTRIFNDADEARDVLHEAILQAWRDRHRFDADRGSGGAWLHTIARTRALDRLRRLASQRIGRSRLALPMPISGEADRRVAVSELRRAVAMLPSAQREVMSRQLDDRSQSEIAAELGLPLGTVKARMRASILRLRDSLGLPDPGAS